VVLAVNVSGVKVDVAVAAAERVIVLELTTDTTVVPVGIPVPVTIMPTWTAPAVNPLAPSRFMTVALPLVRSPSRLVVPASPVSTTTGAVNVTDDEVVAVAGWLRVIEFGALTAVTTVPAGTPAPSTSIPTRTLAVVAVASVIELLVAVRAAMSVMPARWTAT
jgi:hypothetical protein